MAIRDKLREGYQALRSSVGTAGRNFSGNRFIPGPTQGQQQMVSTVGRTAKGFVTDLARGSGIPQLFSGATQNFVNTGKFLGNVATGKTKIVPRSELHKYQQDPSQRLAQQGTDKVMFQAAPRIAMTAAAPLAGRAAMLTGAGLGGVIGGVSAKFTGQDVATGIGRGMSEGVRTAGLNKITAPVINPLTSRMGAMGMRGAVLLENKKPLIRTMTAAQSVGSKLGRMAGQGLGNVAEDEFYTRVQDGRKSTTGERLASFLLGSTFEGILGKPSNLEIDTNGYLINKAGRMFDPVSGSWVKASKKIQQAQEKAVSRLVKVEPTPDRPLGGYERRDLARSRLTQGGFARLGGTQPTKGGDVKQFQKEWDEALMADNFSTMRRIEEELRSNGYEIKGGDVTKIKPTKGVEGATKAKTQTPQTLVPVRTQQPTAKTLSTSDQTQPQMPSQAQFQQGRIVPPGQVPPTSNNLSGSKKSRNIDLPHSYSKVDELYTQFVDRFHPLSKLAKSAGKDRELARSLAKYYGSGSTATYHLEYELSPILKKHDINDLKQAAIAMRDIELNSRGIKGSPEQKKAQATLTELSQKLGPEKMQELGNTLKELYAYQDNMVKQYLVDTGIMSNKAYQEMRKNNQFYVPMKRVMNQVDDMLGIPVKRGAGSVGKQNVIFGIKGSDKEIVDPIESIVENSYKLVSLGRRQEVAQNIASLRAYFPESIKRVLKSDQRNTISLFENGKKVYYSVPDEVAEAARGLGEEQLVMLAKILKVPTDVFRTMTTGVNPEFALPNVFRDLQSAVINTGLNPVKWGAGLAHLMKKDDVYREFLKSGGMTSFISLNKPMIKRTAEELASTSKHSFVVKSPKDVYRGLELLGQYSEQPTRIANFKKIYDQSIKAGMSEADALAEAAYWAQEGTVNFSRRGSKMSNINAIYAYLNARIQGVDRMIRTTKQNPKDVALRFGTAFLAPSLALYAWNSQNPEYYDERIVSKRDKQDNFIVMLPKGEYPGGIKYLKIPKAEVGKIVNPVESFLDFARGKGGDVWSSALDTLKSFSPIDNIGGTVPTAIKPLVEQSINKNTYTGYDIVPEYRKNLPAGYQDTNYTSPLYRAIGRNTNISPARLQHLSESYLGGMARLGDAASRPFISDEYKTEQNMRGATVNQTPMVRRFAGGEKMSELEQLEKNKSRQDTIMREISTLQNRALDGTISEEAANKQIAKLQKELQNQPQVTKDLSLGSLTSEQVFKKKRDLGLSVTDDEATAYYMREIPAKSDSKYKNAIREDKIFSRISDINNSDSLPEAQKQKVIEKLAKEAGYSKEDFNYYTIAKDDNDVKTLFVMEQIERLDDKELTNYLAYGRKKVRGSMVVSNGVLDNLYDEGIISKSQLNYLKKLEWNETEKKVKVKRSSGSGKKMITDAELLTAFNKAFKAANPPQEKKATLGDVLNQRRKNFKLKK